jgi:hypothetical protein
MTKTRKTKSGSVKGHIRIPHIVMDTDDYRNLPPNAVKLLNALVYQFRGKNNGDLTAAFTYMKDFGFKSQETLTKARDSLLEAGLIVKTRQGQFMNPGGRCALYALTWLPIDECSGKQLEIGPTNLPWRKFSLEKNRKPNPVSGHGSTQFSYPQAANGAS